MIKLYKATLCISMVILKDYPEFFAEFHFSFVNALPERLSQLRNVILSAYPSHIKPPNPFNKQLKVDLL